MGAPLKKVKQPSLFEAFKTPPSKAAPTVEIEPLAKALLWFCKQQDIEGKDLVHFWNRTEKTAAQMVRELPMAICVQLHELSMQQSSMKPPLEPYLPVDMVPYSCILGKSIAPQVREGLAPKTAGPLPSLQILCACAALFAVQRHCSNNDSDRDNETSSSRSCSEQDNFVTVSDDNE